MILVDANILLYAQDSLSPHHAAVRKWWDEKLSGSETVALCWPVISAFLRITTNPRVMQRPLTIAEAEERVDSWLQQPCVRLIVPGNAHWPLFRELLARGNATANLVSDAHLAALAVEHGAELISTDTDFARFTGLKWRNPLLRT